jgi:hypothetical protein
MRRSVADRVVLVTGPARGIGAEVARRLAARGARLSLVGLEPAQLAALAAELGPGHVWHEADVTDQDTLARAVAHTRRTLGGIDVVVANAGVASNGTVAVAPIEALVRVIDVNLTGVVRTVHATLPAVVERRGYFLLVASAAALAGVPGISTYAAAKAGVEQFGNVLRLELAHLGVDVGVAYPSWIDTDLVRDQRRELRSFDAMLQRLPGPLGMVTPLAACADALADAVERRARRVYVPRALAPFAALRQLLTGTIAQRVLARDVRRILPEHEREVRALGRSFGATSVGLGAARAGARASEPGEPDAT